MKVQLVLNSNTFAEVKEHAGKKGLSVKNYVLETARAFLEGKVKIPTEMRCESKVQYIIDLPEDVAEGLFNTMSIIEGVDQKPAKLLRQILLTKTAKTLPEMDLIAVEALEHDRDLPPSRGGRKRKGDGTKNPE